MTYQFKTIDNSGDPAFNQLLAVNNSGTIAGYFGDGTILPNKGYVVTAPYGAKSFTNENFPTSVQTQVTGINDSGTTVGFWVDGNGNSYGFIDENGTYSTALDPLAPTIGGIVNEQFLGINDAGDVAGFYTNDGSGDSSGFVYDSSTGAYTAITMKGAVSLTATDVNNLGQVSGFFTNGSGATDGFVDTNGKFLVLSGPAGASDVNALGLNDAGLVVGSYMDSSGNTDGFVYDIATNTYTTVDDPKGNGTMTVLNGVNDQGQMVGFYQDASGNVNGMLVSPGSQTFLWSFHTHDNAADPAFNQLLAINDAGTIAGYDGDGTVLPNKGYTLASPYNAKSYTSENFPSSAQTQVTGINNAGETSGFWVDANGNSYGFVDDNGRYITATDPLAPTINGVVSEQFLGINDEGQVAGFFTNDAAGDTSGFVYDTSNGTFTAVKIAGATSITATDINDKGQILGLLHDGRRRDRRVPRHQRQDRHARRPRRRERRERARVEQRRPRGRLLHGQQGQHPRLRLRQRHLQHRRRPERARHDRGERHQRSRPAGRVLPKRQRRRAWHAGDAADPGRERRPGPRRHARNRGEHSVEPAGHRAGRRRRHRRDVHRHLQPHAFGQRAFDRPLTCRKPARRHRAGQVRRRPVNRPDSRIAR